MRTALLLRFEIKQAAPKAVLRASLNKEDAMFSHLVAIDIWKCSNGKEIRIASLDPSQGELVYWLPEPKALYKLVGRIETNNVVLEEALTDWTSVTGV